MPIVSTDCATCNFDVDYSSEVGCDDDCNTGCGDNCGVVNCLVTVCQSKATIVDTPIDAANPETSGCVVDVILDGTSKGVRLPTKEDTILPESEQSVDENGICAIAETITGQSRTGKREYNWMTSKLNQSVYVFAVDNCDRVRMYREKLTRFKETPGQKKGDDLCGIEFEFTNTTKQAFQFVNYTAMGFASPDEFMESLINV